MAIGDLVANLTMNTAPFSRGAAVASSTMKGLSATVATGVGAITAALGPITAVFAGAFAIGSSLSAARGDLQAAQKLAAVIKATGGAAGLSAEEIGAYASELQGVTNFGDEVTVGSAAILATFKEIKGETFKDALASAQDLSTVMGQDLTSSVTQLGKALNDPVKGITALTRVGVSFTQQQKDQIKAMQEAGDIAGAQQVVLAELKSEFGGAAQAVADPWTQLQNTIGDIGENIGYALLPSINAVAKQIQGLIGWIAGASGSFKEIGAIGGVVFSNLGEAGALALSNLQLKLVQLGSEFLHLFTGVIPTLFHNLLIEVENFATGSALATQAIPARAAGQLEKQLQRDVDTLAESLGAKMAAAVAEVNREPAVAAALVPSQAFVSSKTPETQALGIATKGSQEASRAINAALRGEKEKAAEQTADNTEEIAATANQQLGVLEDIRNNWRGGANPVVVTFA